MTNAILRPDSPSRRVQTFTFDCYLISKFILTRKGWGGGEGVDCLHHYLALMLSSLFAADVEFDERYELIDIVQGLMAGDNTLLGKLLSVYYKNNDRNAEEKFEMCSTESIYVSLVLCVVKIVKYEKMDCSHFLMQIVVYYCCYCC